MLNQVPKKNSENISVEEVQAVDAYKGVFKAETEVVCFSLFFKQGTFR